MSKTKKASGGSPALNDLTRPHNMHRCQFRKRRDMASLCHYVWMRFFWFLQAGEPRVDLMVWEIGETINVRPASTAIDESNSEFRPSPPLTFEVWGYRQARKKINSQKRVSPAEISDQLESLEEELWDSMLQAIVEGLKYKHATESYRKYNPNELAFSAVATLNDTGLHQSDMTLVWKNDRGPTVATIRRRATAARGRPLPQGERELSPQKQHLKKLAGTRKRQAEAGRKYAAREKEKAEKRRPSVRRRLQKSIDTAMAAGPPSAAQAGIAKPRFPLCLDQGNQNERQVVPRVALERLVDIQVTYRWDNFDEYDNRIWEYNYALLDPALKKANVKRLGTLWNKFNRPQKMLFTFVSFVGQVDNGGVWQFLYNLPELSFAALETLTEIGATRLAGDYRRTLEEVLGKAATISKLRELAANERLTDQKRWAAFAQGYKELPSATRIEQYIFGNSFKAALFKRMSKCVESSLHLLGRISETSAA